MTTDTRSVSLTPLATLEVFVRKQLLFLIGSLGLLLPVLASAQQTSDPVAMTAIKQSVIAMGGSAPTDYTASGTVQITAGGSSKSATFTVKTRGLFQTRETIQAPNGTQDRVYSSGQGSTVASTAVTPVSLEQASSFQTGLFLLPLLQAALNNSDTVFQYVGAETLSGNSVYHVRFWNSYASQKPFQGISTFSRKDVWLDTTTYLPRRMSFDSRAAEGAAIPTVHIDLDFTAFQSYGGILYPASVTEYLNRTKWASFTVQSVGFSTGLTDTDFPVQ